MLIAPFLELKPAPRPVFDSLPERRTRVRFMVPTIDGDWQAVTWGCYAKGIRQAGLFLATLLQPGQRAAIYAPNSVEWITAAMAIQSVGGVMVPVYAANTAAQAAYVVNHSDARVLFVDTPELLQRVLEAWGEYGQVSHIFTLRSRGLELGPIIEKMRNQGLPVPPVAEVERKLGAARDREVPGEFDRLLANVTLEQGAQMLYTSGTSGNPKGVPLTHKNVGINGLDWLVSNAPLLELNDVDLLWLPMSHIFGFGEACLGNALGWMSYMSEPAKVLQHLKEVRPTVLMSVPAIWEKLTLLAMKESDAPKQQGALLALPGGALRFCLSGGAGLLIIEGYGLTETSPTLTLNRPDAFRFDSVGKVLPSVELKLADDGEIW